MRESETLEWGVEPARFLGIRKLGTERRKWGDKIKARCERFGEEEEDDDEFDER